MTEDARSHSLLGRLWQTDRMLTGAGFALLGLLAVAVAGLWLDPRTITGMPAWLKPAKFAISTSIYALTLAWIFQWLPEWRKVRTIAGRATVAVFAIELAIVFLQAWRGRTSHFNVATPLDGVLFAVMGAGILTQTFAAIAVCVALWRQTFVDAALGWALRLGLTISVLGSAVGGLMTSPTPQQLAEARATRVLQTAGAHTVGAPDGGPGLPGTGWSLDHGDLRVPHFFGLHAVQALPFLVFALGRRLAKGSLVRATIAGAAAYTGLFVILLWQALRGESVAHPGPSITTALGVWAVVTATAFVMITITGRPASGRVHAAL